MFGTLIKMNENWFVLENKTVKNCFGCRPRSVKFYHKLHPDQSNKLFEMNVLDFDSKNVEFEIDDEYVKITTMKELLVGSMAERNQKLGLYDQDGDDKLKWDEIEEEYYKDNYPPFGGPFTDALKPFEWLKLYYNTPNRKNENRTL